MYTVYELFYSLQGEGAMAGRAAVFCRFAGCNLWNGREQDRAHAVCRFCDTHFVGTSQDGGKFLSAGDLAAQIDALWQGDARFKWVIFTGGEPLLQLDDALILACQARGFAVAVESNGSLLAPKSLNWLCISPKIGATWQQQSGQELKVIWPQKDLSLAQINDFLALDFQYFFLQPLDVRVFRHHLTALTDVFSALKASENAHNAAVLTALANDFLSALKADFSGGQNQDFPEIYASFSEKMEFLKQNISKIKFETQDFAKINAAIVASLIAHCLHHPPWRLSLQTHKISGIR